MKTFHPENLKSAGRNGAAEKMREKTGEETPERYNALLGEILRPLRRVLVAYSGGVDSALVLKTAARFLGPENVLGVTAVSPAVPRREIEIARRIAHEIGVEHRTIDTGELEKTGYVQNGPDRCFFCKSTLYTAMEPIRTSEKYNYILNGTNADDPGDWRPGLKAARDAGVRSPLLEAGLSKNAVRALARHLGLSVWNKPAAPCLASRIPYHSPVTAEKLAQIEAAELILFDAGLLIFRVRHHDEIARLELSSDDLEKLLNPRVRTGVNEKIKTLGFRYVTLDLGDFESGNLNQALERTE